MRFSKGFFSLLLFLAAGALIGGILGQVLGSANLVGLMPFLTETYEISDFTMIIRRPSS